MKRTNLIFPLILLGVGTAQAVSFNAGDTKVTLKGYVKVDAYYDMRNNVNDGTTLNTAGLDSDQNSATEYHFFRMHARQTRFGLGTVTPTNCGKVKSYIELDFFGTQGNASLTNPNTPRMRHAFIKWKNWLAGQTWTTFQDTKTYPETLDFENVVGHNFIRQAMLRYTYKTGNWTVAGALENPGGPIGTDDMVTYGTGNVNNTQRFKAPDVTAFVKYVDSCWGHARLNMVYRSLHVSNDAALENQHEGVLGLGLSAKLKVWGKSNLRLNFSSGKGIGRYIKEARGTALACSDVTGACTKQRATSMYAGYQHVFNDKWRANLAVAKLDIQNVAELNNGTSNRKLKSMHLNGIYKLTKNLDAGLEYNIGSRDLENSSKGHVKRVQASVKLKF